MELMIQNGENPNVDEYIYYVNNAKYKTNKDQDNRDEEFVDIYFDTHLEATNFVEFAKNKANKAALAQKIKQAISNQKATYISDANNCSLFAEFTDKSSLWADFENCDNIKCKINSKIKMDDYSKIKKKNFFTVRVSCSFNKLNCVWVREEDLDQTSDYNPYKYLHKLNSALKTLLIVFHPDYRDLLLSKNGEIPNIDDLKLELVSGFPLKGHEDKQKNLATLMIPTDVEDDDKKSENDLWYSMGMHPNFWYNGEYIDKEATYLFDFNTKNYIKKEETLPMEQYSKYNTISARELIKELSLIQFIE
jgi:hypothetical protein